MAEAPRRGRSEQPAIRVAAFKNQRGVHDIGPEISRFKALSGMRTIPPSSLSAWRAGRRLPRMRPLRSQAATRNVWNCVRSIGDGSVLGIRDNLSRGRGVCQGDLIKNIPLWVRASRTWCTRIAYARHGGGASGREILGSGLGCHRCGSRHQPRAAWLPDLHVRRVCHLSSSFSIAAMRSAVLGCSSARRASRRRRWRSAPRAW